MDKGPRKQQEHRKVAQHRPSLYTHSGSATRKVFLVERSFFLCFYKVYLQFFFCYQNFKVHQAKMCAENTYYNTPGLAKMFLMRPVPQVIRLSNCIRVSEVDVNGCPKDTGSFLVETTEKMYVFAADRNQVGDWIHKLCEIAFPVGTHSHTHTYLKANHQFMLNDCCKECCFFSLQCIDRYNSTQFFSSCELTYIKNCTQFSQFLPPQKNLLQLTKCNNTR